MGLQARITFTTLNDTIFPPKRVITLNPEIKKVVIGRSSRSSSKDLHSSEDNAWFESPVMSRNHAEISLDADSKSLILRDMGSMHGTFLNNFQLAYQMPTKLQSGDLVLFGSEVKRGSETFQPCKFIINYEISSYETGNTFTCTDVTCYKSITGDGSEDNDIRLRSEDVKQHQIDILSDERKIDNVDILDKECKLELATSITNYCNQTSGRASLEEMASGSINHNIPRSTETTESDRTGSDQTKTVAERKDFTISLKDQEEKQLTCDSSSQSTKYSQTSIHSDEKKTTSSNESVETEKVPTLWSSTEAPETQIKVSCNKYKSEKKNITGYTTQSEYKFLPGIDQVHTLFSDELTLRHGFISPLCNFDRSRESGKGKTKVDYESIQNTVEELDQTEPDINSESAFSLALASDRPFSGSENGSCITNKACISKAIKLQHGQDQSFGACHIKKHKQPLDQVLGNKTGKFAYFSAREFNKIKLRSMGYCMKDMQKSCISLGKQAQKQNSQKYMSFEYSKLQGNKDESSLLRAISLHDSKRKFSGWNGCFLTKKYLQGKLERDPCLNSGSPSASVCNFSKSLATASNNGSSIENKRHNSIHSEITVPIKSNHRKRKAETVPSIYCGNFQSTSSTSLPNQESPTSLSIGIHGEIGSSDARPTKRRKILEIFGYAAFGGFAAATGLFSLLVATAPDFP